MTRCYCKLDDDAIKSAGMCDQRPSAKRTIARGGTPVGGKLLCRGCGRKFARVGRGQFYCTDECRDDQQRKRERDRKRKYPRPSKCVDCGTAIVQTQYNRVRCDSCRRFNNRATFNRRYRERHPRRVCEQCGREQKIMPRRGVTPEQLCVKCHNRTYQREYARKKAGTEFENRVCVDCSAGFVAPTRRNTMRCRPCAAKQKQPKPKPQRPIKQQSRRPSKPGYIRKRPLPFTTIACRDCSTAIDSGSQGKRSRCSSCDAEYKKQDNKRRAYLDGRIGLPIVARCEICSVMFSVRTNSHGTRCRKCADFVRRMEFEARAAISRGDFGCIERDANGSLSRHLVSACAKQLTSLRRQRRKEKACLRQSKAALNEIRKWAAEPTTERLAALQSRREELERLLALPD